MALSADRLMTVQGPVEVFKGKLTASNTYYKGALVQFDATTGLLKEAADVATEFAIGWLKEGKVVPAASNPTVEVCTGKVWIPFGSAAQGDVGDYVYATDDGTIAKSATNSGPLGLCIDFKTGYLLVDTRRGLPKTAMA